MRTRNRLSYVRAAVAVTSFAVALGLGMLCVRSFYVRDFIYYITAAPNWGSEIELVSADGSITLVIDRESTERGRDTALSARTPGFFWLTEPPETRTFMQFDSNHYADSQWGHQRSRWELTLPSPIFIVLLLLFPLHWAWRLSRAKHRPEDQ